MVVDAGRAPAWRSKGAPFLGAGAFLAVFLAWSRLAWFGPGATRIFVDVATTAIPLGAGWLAIREARRVGGPWRAVWLLLGLAAISWGLGNAAWTYFELVAREAVPFPSLADVGYLVFLPLAGAALFRLVSADRSVSQPLRALLDGLLIAAATLFLARALFLRSLIAYASQQPTLLAQAVALAYPLGDLVLLALIVLALSRVRREARPCVAALAGALAALTCADMGFWYFTAQGTYETGAWTDAGWVACFLVLGLATRQRAPDDAVAPSEPGLGSAIIPLVPFALATIASVAIELRDGSLEPFLYWNAVIVIGLLLARQFIALRENIALRRQREDANSLLESTLESTADGILVVSTEGRFTHHNHQFAEMWGIPAKILQDGDDDEALHFVLKQLKNPAEFLAKVEDLYARPNDSSLDVLEFGDGRIFERYSRPQYQDGKVVGRVWSFRDVTEHRRLEDDRLREAVKAEEYKRLHETDRFKNQFLNMAAHELNTPLTPIRLQTSMLLNGAAGQLDARAAHAVGIIDRNTKRLTALAKEILDVARMQGGGLRFQFTTFPVEAAVAETLDSFQDAAVNLGIELVAEVPEGLTANTDRNRLVQILSNLVSNGLRFTPSRGKVSVIALQRPQVLEVLVADTGIGMNAHQIAQIFRPFVQVHDPMQITTTGAGLGLYISRGLAEAMGGTLTCESAGPASGTAFYLTLPWQDGLAPDTTVPAVAIAGDAMQRRLRELI